MTTDIHADRPDVDTLYRVLGGLRDRVRAEAQTPPGASADDTLYAHMRKPGRVFTDQERRGVQRVLAEGDDLPPSWGERNSAAKMTEDKVRALRASADAGIGLSGLADAFDIDVRTARHIVQYTTWRHVE